MRSFATLLFGCLILTLAEAMIPAVAVGQNLPDEYFISCDPDSFDYIYENWWLDYYIPCTITYQGQDWPDCRLRIRGDSSRIYPKKSLKVKTDGALFWNGRDTINFNADYLDETYLHTVLSSRLFREAGVPCFESAHARLFLNGSFLGLYISVENMDEDFLNAQGMDPNGNLYKSAKDGACLSIWDNVPVVWEKKTNEECSWDDLYQLIDEINNVSDEDYFSWSQSIFDYGEILNILAMNILLQNGSTYYHNYYMYHDINGSGKWLMMPWDLDKTIGYYNWLPYYRSSSYNMPDNPCLERAILCETMFTDLWDRIHVLADSLYNRDRLDPVIDSLVVVLESSVAADTTDQIENLDDWYDLIATEQQEAIGDRIADLDVMYAEWPHTFRVDRLQHAFRDSVTLTWHPSKELSGDPFTYKVKYSTDANWPTGETWNHYGITDTTFTIPVLLPEGEYFYEICAMDGDALVPGFDSLSRFYVDAGTDVPPVISGFYTMTETGSPYHVEGEVLVESGAVLNVQAGVEIYFAQDASILVLGQLHFNGSEAQPIRLMPEFDAESWECISFDAAAGTSNFQHVIVEDGTEGDEPWQKAAISIRNTDVTMEHMFFRDNVSCIYSEGSNVSILNSEFSTGNLGGQVKLRFGNALVERCIFRDVYFGNGVDYDGTPEGVIRDCEFYSGAGNAIDIGEEAIATVEGNLIVGFEDAGVSVGEHSTATIERNIISGCSRGVAVKDNSYSSLDHNTFYADTVAVSCYEENAGMGGGNADLRNSILAASIVSSLEIEEQSTIDVSWCISDTDLLPGEGNIQADPELLSPEELDFRLLRSSPCINAGDPESPPDPDGTRSDIGAIPYNLGPEFIVINEINYHSAPDFDPEDWIEFYNTSALSVDLSGTYFKDGDNAHIFLFEGVTIHAGAYLVLCRDLFAFHLYFPDVHDAIGDMDFGFSGGGEMLRYYDEFDGLIDHVNYDDDPPWPVEPDGGGPTLELRDPDFDNSMPENWAASIAAHGTPGSINSVTDPSAVQESAPPFITTLGRSFPNPFNPRTTIPFSLAAGGHLRLSVHDVRGRLVTILAERDFQRGSHVLDWDGFDQRGHPATSGLYFLRMEAPGYLESRKMVLLR